MAAAWDPENTDRGHKFIPEFHTQKLLTLILL